MVACYYNNHFNLHLFLMDMDIRRRSRSDSYYENRWPFGNFLPFDPFVVDYCFKIELEDKIIWPTTTTNMWNYY